MSPPRRKPRTITSNFGSTGRANHDATPFYASRLMAELPLLDTPSGAPYAENPLPAAALDSIFCKSCEAMDDLPDASVHLMVTSPPYNVGKQYDDDLSLSEYLAFLTRAWREVKRVLVPGGRACINVANLGRKPYIPLHAFILESMLDLGFLMRGEIIWNKAAGGSPSTAWGSWMSATNPILRDAHEYILVFCKDTYTRHNPGRKNTIGRDEFLEYTKSVWTFAAEAASKIGHPAPFPIELPRRLIQLYSLADEVVLDPFMGSGQTAIAALRAGRHFVGYETNAAYVELATRRLADVSFTPAPVSDTESPAAASAND